MSFVNATSPWANKNCVMSVKKCGGQTGNSNLGVLDDETERSNEIGNEGGASGLVFFGMQVELAFGAITR
jgi:hypothetical protein